MVKPAFHCELEAGHGGRHFALAQSSENEVPSKTNWWIAWLGDTREWDHTPTCLVEGADGECCVLPASHVGGHEWQWNPLPCWKSPENDEEKLCKLPTGHEVAHDWE
ncbi:hypothetical protein [Streptomyces sp. NPDC002640]